MSYLLLHTCINTKIQCSIIMTGAFGTATLYRRKADSSLVIMKEIEMQEMSADDRRIALKEAQILSILHHPSIVQFFNAYEFQGRLLIEMEYCEDGTLADFLSCLLRPLPEVKILLIFQQIASALSYLSEKKILHRDIKTGNIFMAKHLKVKLGDFGIAKVLSTQKPAASTLIGTPLNFSPELVCSHAT